MAWLLACALLAGSVGLVHAAELTSLRTEKAEDGIYLSYGVDFELPAPVEDALRKGIALIFVTEADIYRERWYWTDKRVSTASRSVRLAFQPLTRRWRVSLTGEGGRVTLSQGYDSLPEAQAAIKRVSRWKIAEVSDVDASAHTLDFRFRLDLGQLPRPFQIGIAGQREWQVMLSRTGRLRLEKSLADPPPSDK